MNWLDDFIQQQFGSGDQPQTPNPPEPDDWVNQFTQSQWGTTGGQIGRPTIGQPPTGSGGVTLDTPPPEQPKNVHLFGLPFAPEIPVDTPLIGGISKAIGGAFAPSTPDMFNRQLRDDKLWGIPIRALEIPVNLFNEEFQTVGRPLAGLGEFGIETILKNTPIGDWIGQFIKLNDPYSQSGDTSSDTRVQMIGQPDKEIFQGTPIIGGLSRFAQEINEPIDPNSVFAPTAGTPLEPFSRGIKAGFLAGDMLSDYVRNPLKSFADMFVYTLLSSPIGEKYVKLAEQIDPNAPLSTTILYAVISEIPEVRDAFVQAAQQHPEMTPLEALRAELQKYQDKELVEIATQSPSIYKAYQFLFNEIRRTGGRSEVLRNAGFKTEQEFEQAVTKDPIGTFVQIGASNYDALPERLPYTGVPMQLLTGLLFDPLTHIPSPAILTKLQNEVRVIEAIKPLAKMNFLERFWTALPKVDEALQPVRVLKQESGAMGFLNRFLFDNASRATEFAKTAYTNLMHEVFAKSDNFIESLGIVAKYIDAAKSPEAFAEFSKTFHTTLGAQRAIRLLEGLDKEMTSTSKALGGAYKLVADIIQSGKPLNPELFDWAPTAIRQAIRAIHDENLKGAQAMHYLDDAARIELLDSIATVMANRAKQIFGVKAPNPIQRVVGLVKSVEALLYLGTSPVTLVRNFINNRATMAVDGLNPFMTKPQIQTFLSRLGIPEQALKPMDRIASVIRSSSTSGMGVDVVGGLAQKISDFADKYSLLKFYRSIEEADRLRAFASGAKNAFSTNAEKWAGEIWNTTRGKAILERLRQIDENAPKVIEKIISANLGDKERAGKAVMEYIEGMRTPYTAHFYDKLAQHLSSIFGGNLTSTDVRLMLGYDAEKSLDAAAERIAKRVLGGEKNINKVVNEEIAKVLNEYTEFLYKLRVQTSGKPLESGFDGVQLLRDIGKRIEEMPSAPPKTLKDVLALAEEKGIPLKFKSGDEGMHVALINALNYRLPLGAEKFNTIEDVIARADEAYELLAGYQKGVGSALKDQAAKFVKTQKAAGEQFQQVAKAIGLELKDPSKYYVYVKDDKTGEYIYQAVNGKRVEIPGFEMFDFFLHKTVKGEGWTISEGITGAALVSGKTQKEAIAELQKQIIHKTPDSFLQSIVGHLSTAFQMPSPRYWISGAIELTPIDGITPEELQLAQKAVVLLPDVAPAIQQAIKDDAVFSKSGLPDGVLEAMKYFAIKSGKKLVSNDEFIGFVDANAKISPISQKLIGVEKGLADEIKGAAQSGAKLLIPNSLLTPEELEQFAKAHIGDELLPKISKVGDNLALEFVKSSENAEPMAQEFLQKYPYLEAYNGKLVNHEEFVSTLDGLVGLGKSKTQAPSAWGLTPEEYKEAVQKYASANGLQASFKKKGDKFLVSLDKPETKGNLKIFVEQPSFKPVEPVHLSSEQSLNLVKIGGQMGSNPGGVFSSKVGELYVKFHPNENQTWTSFVTNELYKELGIGVPDVFLFEGQNGKIGYASLMIKGGKTIGSNPSKEVAGEVARGIVADILTANWDVVGSAYDNILVVGDKVYRIDPGGTLLYRAQGALKPESAIKNIEEWYNFANPSVSKYAQILKSAGYKSVEDIGATELVRQFNDITALVQKYGSWRDFVNAKIPNAPASLREDIADMLSTRYKLLGDKIAQIASEQTTVNTDKINNLFDYLANKGNVTQSLVKLLNPDEKVFVLDRLNKLLEKDELLHIPLIEKLKLWVDGYGKAKDEARTMLEGNYKTFGELIASATQRAAKALYGNDVTMYQSDRLHLWRILKPVGWKENKVDNLIMRPLDSFTTNYNFTQSGEWLIELEMPVQNLLAAWWNFGFIKTTFPQEKEVITTLADSRGARVIKITHFGNPLSEQELAIFIKNNPQLDYSLLGVAAPAKNSAPTKSIHVYELANKKYISTHPYQYGIKYDYKLGEPNFAQSWWESLLPEQQEYVLSGLAGKPYKDLSEVEKWTIRSKYFGETPPPEVLEQGKAQWAENAKIKNTKPAVGEIPNSIGEIPNPMGETPSLSEPLPSPATASASPLESVQTSGLGGNGLDFGLAIPDTIEEAARSLGRFKPPTTVEGLLENQANAYATAYADFLNQVAPIIAQFIEDEMKRGIPKVPDALKGDIAKWLASDVASVHDDSVKAAFALGKLAEKRALLDYDSRYHIDGAISYLQPFAFWRLHSAQEWAQRFIDRPSLAAFYLHALRDLDTVKNDPSYPARLRGKTEIPMPLVNMVAPYLGKGVFVDIPEAIFPLKSIYATEMLSSQYAGVKDEDVAAQIRALIDAGAVSKEEGEKAIINKSGSLWDAVKADLKSGEGGVGGFSELFKLHTPLDLALRVATGNTRSYGTFFPFTSLVRGLSSPFVKGGINPDATVKKALSALTGQEFPEFDAFDEYRQERALRNLVAEGAISPQEAIIAMMEHKGRAWDMAVDRNAKEGFIPALTSLAGLRGTVFTEGERRYYQARLERDRLVDSELQRAGYDPSVMSSEQKWDTLKKLGLLSEGTPLFEFGKQHPEISVTGYLFAEQEGRLSKFLSDEVKRIYYDSLSSLDRRRARNMLGQDFADFVAGNKSDVDLDTLATWAKTLNGYIPKAGVNVNTSKAKEFIESDPTLSQQYEYYLTQRGAVQDVLDEYYRLPDELSKRVYLNKHPELKAFFAWEDKFFGQNPELVKAMGKDQPQVYARKGNEPQQSADAANIADPELAAEYRQWLAHYNQVKDTMDKYYALPTDQRKAFLREHPELEYYFKWNDDFWKNHPELAKMIGREERTQKPRDNSGIARIGKISYGGGGGGRVATQAPTRQGGYEGTRNLWADLQGQVDNELLQMISAWLQLNPGYREVYARMNKRLQDWLASKPQWYLDKLIRDYLYSRQAMLSHRQVNKWKPNVSYRN